MKKVQMTKAKLLESGVLKSMISKLKAPLVSALLVLGLAVSPVQASHYHDVIAPLATVAVLTYLFNNNRHHSSYRSRTYYSYGYKSKGQHRRPQRQTRRKHSHSSGGYSNHSKSRYQH
ncbi:MAG: hypothetical protein ACI8XX_002402 [Polaribacter sp.]|jgi:hypothetical protein